MPDPSRMLGREGHRVGAADEQVPGVQAQADPAAGKHVLDIAAGLDHGANVRVHGRGDPEPACDQGKPVEVGQQHLPAVIVDHRTHVIPGGAGHGSQHERACAGGGEGGQCLLDLGDRVEGRVVQHDGHEAADST